MALNYETLIRAASKSPEQRTTTEINDFIFPWLKQSLKKKQGIFQKLSDDVIHDICKTIILERRPAWDVVIHQGDPGDTFYIILQGSVNIYRFDDDGPKIESLVVDTVKEFTKLDVDPDKREELIALSFGNYIVTLEGNGLAYDELGGFDFGERALVTNEPRSATVMTITPTDLLVVDREVFSRTLKAAHERELQEKTEFINRCPLFSSWSPRLKRLVSLNIERGRFSYDNVLYKQGTRADAVYFIWSGEIKLSMDPLLHWLQYPYLLPQSDPMRQRAMELFLPMLQPVLPANVHIPSALNQNGHKESYAIKRRHMTFAQAEKERTQRILQLALLGAGDIIGLECYICDLATHINSARCTGPCDLFYILHHNFIRLQKRHGTQGLAERLREMVVLSLQAYPSRIMDLPLFTVLMKKQLAPPVNDDQQQNHSKQSWLLRINNSSQSYTRRAATTANGIGKDRLAASNNTQTKYSSRYAPFESAAAVQYVTNDHIRVGKIEDRLKKWHAQMGDDAKPQIRPLTRYNVARSSANDSIRPSSPETYESQSNGVIGSASMYGNGHEQITRLDHHVDPASSINEPVSACSNNILRSSSTTALPPICIYLKQQRYKDVRVYLKQAWRDFLNRPVPSLY